MSVLFWHISLVDGVWVTGYCLASGYFAAVRALAGVGDPLFVCWSFSRCAFLGDMRDALKELRVMVAGGVRLEEAFQYVGRSQLRVAAVFRSMYVSLLSGAGVGGVMRTHLADLDVVLVGILSVCESARGWSRSLEQAVVYLDARIRSVKFVRQALLYPILVVSVLWGVVVFYLYYLAIEVGWGFFAWLVVTLAWCALVSAYLAADRLTWNRGYMYAYYFSSLGLLMRGGHALQDALCIVGEAFQDRVLLDVQEKVLAGIDLHVALLGVSDVAARVMRAGEYGGSVGSACEHIGELYLEGMQQSIARLGTLFGPCILMFVGAVLVMLISTLGVSGELMGL